MSDNLTLTLPSSVLSRAKEEANRQGISLSIFVENAINKYVGAELTPEADSRKEALKKLKGCLAALNGKDFSDDSRAQYILGK